MNVLMKEQVLEYLQYGFWIVFGSGFVCQITPFIKFNPISLILNWVGKQLNRDVKEEITKVDKKVDNLKDDLQTHKLESQRQSILIFADDLMRGERKSKEHFEYVIRTHDAYEKYINENNLENGQVDLAFDYISNSYKESMKNNSFYSGK